MNHKIRAPRVRCIDAAGNMVGVISSSEAIAMSRQQGLDLVEISPNADPPVCRIMNYGKFKYEESIKERQARKRQHAADLKEVKFHSNVAEHDFDTKVDHIRGFLQKGHKVKASLYFRGRENAHRELGFDVMNRVLKSCVDLSIADMAPKLIGNSIVMVLGPRSQKVSTMPGSPPAPVAGGIAQAPRPAAPTPATAAAPGGAPAPAAAPAPALAPTLAPAAAPALAPIVSVPPLAPAAVPAPRASQPPPAQAG